MNNEIERVVEAKGDGNSLHFRFAVVGSKGAIEFHFQTIPQSSISAEWEPDNLMSLGVETHYRNAPDYMSDKQPSYTDCHLLKGNCWHDGTSLWASEYWMPNFKQGGTAWLWPQLEKTYYDRFEPTPATEGE